MTSGMVAVMSSSIATRPLFTAIMPNNNFNNNSSLTLTNTKCRTRRLSSICCEVALRSDSVDHDEDLKTNLDKVGCKIKVKRPLKVYHVPKLPEVELTPDMVGVVKQYVGFWKGKRISPNYPFKVEFFIDVPGRGSVKLFAHLREDEFDIV
ncbi:ferredoxin-thioredoxin reductase, variable chain, chloroplastic-like [Chenopodium quinoa]|uniref:Ferredoxin thioredoxin reductase alpha chain domain-containing protein n=1 Tax=Chenopodium quinoa TaxID=63459 RepID=A0A803N0L3_CHEQI|nr:ferredoxin-thioredoxin reductase, variable chain, chloroplastic-like [Chenopodium quinoa]